MASPHLHQNIRKRTKKRHAYPSNRAFIRWFDRLVIIAGALMVIATVPQVLEIWVNKSADGVSTLSWSYYVFYSVLFTLYGFIHREFPIIFNYSLATFMYALVMIGSIIY